MLYHIPNIKENLPNLTITIELVLVHIVSTHLYLLSNIVTKVKICVIYYYTYLYLLIRVNICMYNRKY